MEKLLLLIIMLPLCCGLPMDRIVGGVDAMRKEWPWQISLQQKGFPICGGALLTNSWVMTAAHCFQEPVNLLDFTIYLGAYQLTDLQDPTAVARGVKQILVNPIFTEEGSSGDIALMELDTPITFTTSILPVSLPSPSINLPEGTFCWATGWGNIQNGVPLSNPKTLQMVQLPLIDHQHCEAMYDTGLSPGAHLIKDDMICAGYPEGIKDSCQGDSGGPLVCNVNGEWLQFGINSWGFGCAEPNHPGVYTKVQYYESWIQKYIPDIHFRVGGTALYPGSTFNTTGLELTTNPMTTTVSSTATTVSSTASTVSSTASTVSSTATTVSSTTGTVSSTTGTVSSTTGTVSSTTGTGSSTTGTVSSTTGTVISTTDTVSSTPYNPSSKDLKTMSTVPLIQTTVGSSAPKSFVWSVRYVIFIFIIMIVISI